jgi:ABC-type branched-subunit amino acid transport system ATPase component
MLGSGRTELLRGIFGADRIDSGMLTFNGEVIDHPNPTNMNKRGLAFTPEDRKLQGLVQILSIKDNLCHASLDQMSPGGFVDTKTEKEFADRQVKSLQIKTTSIDLPMTSLSGGNQQKVVVGKWLNAEPKVIILDEPSRGIDVNAKQQIFQIIWDQSQRGVSSIVVSSELEELLEVCHRIIIMRLGRFVGEVRPRRSQHRTTVFALHGRRGKLKPSKENSFNFATFVKKYTMELILGTLIIVLILTAPVFSLYPIFSTFSQCRACRCHILRYDHDNNRRGNRSICGCCDCPLLSAHGDDCRGPCRGRSPCRLKVLSSSG